MPPVAAPPLTRLVGGVNDEKSGRFTGALGGAGRDGGRVEGGVVRGAAVRDFFSDEKTGGRVGGSAPPVGFVGHLRREMGEGRSSFSWSAGLAKGRFLLFKKRRTTRAYSKGAPVLDAA